MGGFAQDFLGSSRPEAWERLLEGHYAWIKKGASSPYIILTYPLDRFLGGRSHLVEAWSLPHRMHRKDYPRINEQCKEHRYPHKPIFNHLALLLKVNITKIGGLPCHVLPVSLLLGKMYHNGIKDQDVGPGKEKTPLTLTLSHKGARENMI